MWYRQHNFAQALRVFFCHCPGDMTVRMRKVLQTAGLVFECVPCYFRLLAKSFRQFST